MMARIMSAIWWGETQAVNQLAPDLAKANSISEKFLEPLRRQSRIARRILNIAVAEIGLDRARVMAIVGELVAAGMTEHVGVGLDAQIGRGGCDGLTRVARGRSTIEQVFRKSPENRRFESESFRGFL
jgi:hypothetical protein